MYVCIYRQSERAIYYVFAAGPAPFRRNILCRGNRISENVRKRIRRLGRKVVREKSETTMEIEAEKLPVINLETIGRIYPLNSTKVHIPVRRS